MISFLLTFLLFIAFILPLTTFVHELGHAITASTLLKAPVKIRLGTQYKGNGFTLGKINIKIQPLSGWVGFFKHDVPSDKVSKNSNLLIYLAGPIFSLLLFSICLITTSTLNFPTILDHLIKHISNASLLQFFITIVPLKYPAFLGSYSGTYSDGYRILKLLQPR
ncbi:M50 family metallopeptidase [Metabacillus litoralis]|uniref:M50 family metallopeptidase n=1 Tax=Metabacillus litoralis TaxID=152268 RepID=UPI001CFEEAE2|nr:M50 family metallopeptidase [Metabacillus litoralis]